MFVDPSEIRVFGTRDIEKEQSILREHCYCIHAQMSIYPFHLNSFFPFELLIFVSIYQNLINHRYCIDNLPSTLIPVSTHALRSIRKMDVFLGIMPSFLVCSLFCADRQFL
jgi:hypothetical protein